MVQKFLRCTHACADAQDMHSPLGQFQFLETKAKTLFTFTEYLTCSPARSRRSSVTIGTRLRAEYRGSIAGRGNDGMFSLRHHVQTGSAAHSAAYRIGIVGCLPGDKMAKA
jgi:hypothetical protein